MKKKLLSVVLSLAVAFTFSFAAVGTASAAVSEVEWASDYSYVVVDGTKYDHIAYNLVRNQYSLAESKEQWNGMIQASIDEDWYEDYYAGWDSDVIDGYSKAYFYDVTGAEVKTNSGYVKTSYPSSQFDGCI